MGVSIQKLVKPDGTTVYRRWDTRSDRYVTDEMSEEEARRDDRHRLLKRAIYDLLDDQQWELGLHQAKKVTAWESDPEEDECEDEDSEPAGGLDEIYNRLILADDLAEIALNAMLAELARRELKGDAEPDEFRVWWLSEVDDENFTDDTIGELPEYIADEVKSLRGRSGRGRLWVPVTFGEVEATWSDDNPVCRLLGNHGGIVILKKDVDHLPKNVGVVTNLDCELVSP